ncbi:MAG: sigma-70 family RNA polymerase sigma factor [Cytophagales bacterium]|nr:sigma-70 family RNA polymerase sigma factor [Cytophagales bacterium]
MSSDFNAFNETADSTKKSFMDALRRGDTGAYLQLYRECRPTVMNFMRHNNGRPEDGADLLQEAMVVLLQRLQTPVFDLTNARAFVLATVRNKWLEQLRRGRNGPVQFTEMEHLEKVPALPDERTYPITDEQLEAAVNDQEEPCRSLLIRFYYQRQSLEEIAAAMGLVNANSAKTKRFRCMQRLIESVKKQFGDE